MSGTGERLLALAVLGAVLLNYPLLDLFAVDGHLFGLPVLFCYLFTVWGGLIGVVALLQRRRSRQRGPTAPPESRG
ncbi:hypothetical protein [Halorhodospira abdelmalekii]|uniref:hypothetical protein n=1 Tax=Halorhodospira abdelmalekii TaxID=421629 RepID=UPI001905A0A8